MSIKKKMIHTRQRRENPLLKFLQAFALLLLATFAVLVVAAHAVPETTRAVTGRDAAENIFSAKKACLSSALESPKFANFCGRVFKISREGMFLKARTNISGPALAIFVDKDHELNRYLRINANAYEMFGNTQAMHINLIAAYVHVECEISQAQSEGIAGIETISWAFEPSIRTRCGQV
ncbi:hypothetical protein SIAM614_01144 [Stappia aggregata IAM 12614]|uniref:Uncharacterized protein n=1 Tax=Roseibium aggregatum (strain ATCC 25650 / DSM 13394 / JCM 20685 / NBRC 16684 / NCIMB 2208 / IAM 12614 / B1) TaxID=384765 RepID=A0P0N9_ROSAI|nr:hypothetical protein [Roseibium aggregatum]EAV41353.1 hypothetical protein SIAM614_01144 [Stappia aggregata IAM 12614] [Roseibium aggregatum IAM 12614]